MKKVYVDVNATFTKDGGLVPTSFIWENGKKYEIDKVCDCKKAASLKVGGCGMRYTCKVLGKEIYLFFEENKWFVEGK